MKLNICKISGITTVVGQYLPFGESFISQRIHWQTRYTFSAKEKDEATGYSYFGARYYDSETSVWLSVDPLSDKYPHLSPYMYAEGNPVMMVDPNGMATIARRDEYEVKPSGKVTNVKDNDKKDVVYSLDKKGNRLNSIQFKFGTVENLSSGKENGTDYQVLQVRDDKKAKKLFEFLAKPENFDLEAGENVEWSRTATGFKGKKGLNFLTTSWEKDREAGIRFLSLKQLKFGYTVRRLDHNHPNNNPNPSGTAGELGDIPFMKMLKRKGVNFTPDVSFNIYTPGNDKKYNPYDENSSVRLETTIIEP